jgi:hypothetical protein
MFRNFADVRLQAGFWKDVTELQPSEPWKAGSLIYQG